MSELLGDPTEPRRRGGDEKDGSKRLQAAEIEERRAGGGGGSGNSGRSDENEHHRSLSNEPKTEKASPRPPPRPPLPAALVLALRVALTLAVLAVPAIFLQNSDRRRDPLVAALVTLECVSSRRRRRRRRRGERRTRRKRKFFFFLFSTLDPNSFSLSKTFLHHSDRRPRPPHDVDPPCRHRLPPGRLRPSCRRRRRRAGDGRLVRSRKGVSHRSRRRRRSLGGRLCCLGRFDSRNVPDRRARRGHRRRRHLPGL